jgi:hypothetical protein
VTDPAFAAGESFRTSELSNVYEKNRRWLSDGSIEKIFLLKGRRLKLTTTAQVLYNQMFA